MRNERMGRFEDGKVSDGRENEEEEDELDEKLEEDMEGKGE